MNIIRIINKNTNIRIILALCACLLPAIIIHAAATFAFSGNVNITEAFSASDDIKITGCSIESTACLSYDRQYFAYNGGELEKAVLREFVRDTDDSGNAGLNDGRIDYGTTDDMLNNSKIFDGENEKKYSGNNSRNIVAYSEKPVPCYMSDYNNEDYKLYMTVSWSEAMNCAYLHCKIDILSDISRLSAAYNKLADIINEHKEDGKIIDSIIYTRTSAVRSGKMTLRECRLYTEKMFDRLGAESRDSGKGNYYTEYGYSSDMPDYIMSNNEKINVQVSYGYNEINDTTEISVGSPIINLEY